LTARLHDVYAALPNGELDAMLSEADIVVVESGLGIALVPRIRRLNPDCLLIYRGSDTLDTIGAHPHLSTLLDRYANAFDQFCLLSPQMADAFLGMRERTFCVPQGVERAHYEAIGDSPFSGERHAVSVGSMLFDHGVFDVAGEAFPDWTFHVIGCGQSWNCARNVVLYPEMQFLDTLPYLAHADVGVAAYRNAERCRYLADSSMKLAQYAYLRLPAVCPYFAVGDYPHRFGYDPGSADDIVSAFKAAFDDEFRDGSPMPMGWDDLVLRILEPRAFSDTRIPDNMFEPAKTDRAVTQNGGAALSFAGGRSGGEDLRARC
jgi:2-beta-glucuronyltransferase